MYGKDFKHCNTMELPVQFDNINSRVVDDLKEKLTAASSLSVAAASFSIYAFEALKKELEAVRELRFISLHLPLTRKRRRNSNANSTSPS